MQWHSPILFRPTASISYSFEILEFSLFYQYYFGLCRIFHLILLDYRSLFRSEFAQFNKVQRQSVQTFWISRFLKELLTSIFGYFDDEMRSSFLQFRNDSAFGSDINSSGLNPDIIDHSQNNWIILINKQYFWIPEYLTYKTFDALLFFLNFNVGDEYFKFTSQAVNSGPE